MLGDKVSLQIFLMQPFHADCTSQPVFSFIFLQVPWHAISTNAKHYQGFKISFSVIFWSTKNFPRKLSARVTYITQRVGHLTFLRI